VAHGASNKDARNLSGRATPDAAERALAMPMLFCASSLSACAILGRDDLGKHALGDAERTRIDDAVGFHGRQGISVRSVVAPSLALDMRRGIAAKSRRETAAAQG
jgi:hypothetical protein